MKIKVELPNKVYKIHHLSMSLRASEIYGYLNDVYGNGEWIDYEEI